MNSEEQKNYVVELTNSQSRLLTYIRTLLPHSNDTHDILQETNIVLWNKMNEFEPGTNFVAWSYKIAWYQCMAYIRKHKAGSKLVFNQELLEVMSEEMQVHAPDFVQHQKQLNVCIKKLKEDDQSILYKRYYDNISIKECAEIFGRTPGALKQVLLRIRQNLKKCMSFSIAEING